MTDLHLIDLVHDGPGRGHAARLAGLLAADGLTVTLHGAEGAPDGVTACGCSARSRQALARHLRGAVPAGAVAHVHGAAGDDGALAALAALRGRAALVAYSPHGPLPAGGAVATQLLRRRLLLADAVVADGREQAARLGSLGAEAWASPLVLPPSAEAVARWRARLGASDGAPAILVAGEGVLAEQLPDDELAAALAAADGVVADPATVAGTRAADVARQVRTPVLEAGTSAPAAGDQPEAAEPADATRVHRLAYGEAVAASAALPSVAGRPPVAVIAWSNAVGRTAEMAQAFAGEGRLFYDLNITAKRLIPLRYLLSSLRMAAYLVRRRPRAVIVANPPIVPPLIALAYHKLTGAPLMLDSQTSSFGQKASRVGQVMLPLHAWVSRRSTCTLVGAEELGERVAGWGGRPEVFHEAPPLWRATPSATVGRHPRVLWIGVFASDEPLDALLETAARLPHAEFRVTGDLRRAPADRASAPPNVTWLGFVRGRAYPQEIQDADVIVTMTTDATSALRGAAEAVFAERPLITSDWPFLRDLFPTAVHATNDADGLTAAVRAVLDDLDALRARARAGREEHVARWHVQLSRLRAHLGEPAPASAAPAEVTS